MVDRVWLAQGYVDRSLKVYAQMAPERVVGYSRQQHGIPSLVLFPKRSSGLGLKKS